MSDLVGNPEDRFSHNEAYICLGSEQLTLIKVLLKVCGSADSSASLQRQNRFSKKASSMKNNYMEGSGSATIK